VSEWEREEEEKESYEQTMQTCLGFENSQKEIAEVRFQEVLKIRKTKANFCLFFFSFFVFLSFSPNKQTNK